MAARLRGELARKENALRAALADLEKVRTLTPPSACGWSWCKRVQLCCCMLRCCTWVASCVRCVTTVCITRLYLDPPNASKPPRITHHTLHNAVTPHSISHRSGRRPLHPRVRPRTQPREKPRRGGSARARRPPCAAVLPSYFRPCASCCGCWHVLLRLLRCQHLLLLQ